ncbi:MAG TPA: IS110 family transposase [Acidimicrobiales bacterium]
MMVLIGIDPHKATHTAVAVDKEETALGELTVKADRHQVERLLKWAIDFPERRWAIESANGLGFLLAQQLVAVGEDVVDVPPTLAARVRVLGSGKTQKNDPNDALSPAIAALRAKRLRTVVTENLGGVLRLLADHHHDLGSLRTQAVCRLHALVRCLIPGGTGLRLSAARAAVVLRSVRPTNAVDAERKRMALGFVADIRRLDTEIATSKARIVTAVTASGTSVTELYGVGPVVAAFLIGHSGDIARFANRDHYASYNATAPIEASSGPRVRHRLNPRGNRHLNHAIHLIAIAQIRHPNDGRQYFDRKVAEGKTTKEALRALKRQISNAVYRQLVVDSSR